MYRVENLSVAGTVSSRCFCQLRDCFTSKKAKTRPRTDLAPRQNQASWLPPGTAEAVVMRCLRFVVGLLSGPNVGQYSV